MFRYLVIFVALVCCIPSIGNTYHQKRPDVVLEFGDGYDNWSGPGFYYSIWFSNQYQYYSWCQRQGIRVNPGGYGTSYGPGYYEVGPRYGRGYYYSRGGWRHDRDRHHRRDHHEDHHGRGHGGGGHRGGGGGHHGHGGRGHR